MADPIAGVLLDEAGHERVLTSLDRSFDAGSPQAATLGASYTNLVDRAYTASHPGHPQFEPGDQEVRLADLRAVHSHLVRAMNDQDKRVPLQGDASAVRRVANTLGVGHGSETHFIFGDDRFSPWGNELARAAGAAGDSEGPVRVSDLRRWIDAVTPARGLRPEVSDLVVLGWALLRQRAWYHHGAAIEAPSPGKVTPEIELRQQPMPTQDEWARAIQSAAELFGLSTSPYLSPPTVGVLVDQVREQAAALSGPAQALVAELETAYRHLRLPTDPAGRTADRLGTARSALGLVTSLTHADGVEMVRRLGSAVEEGRGAALGGSLKRTGDVAGALRRFKWDRLGALRAADNDEQATRILSQLGQDLTSDEIVTRAADALDQAETGTFDWLSASRPSAPTVPTPEPSKPAYSSSDDVALPTDTPPLGTADRRTVTITRAAADSSAEVVQQLRAFLEEHSDDAVEVSWRVIE